MRIVSDCTDYAKVLKLAQKLAQKELPDKKSAAGTERKRLFKCYYLKRKSFISPNSHKPLRTYLCD